MLDNAASAEQVRPLLPGSPGSLVVVTSRDRLPSLVARDGAHSVHVPGLPARDAAGLVTTMLSGRGEVDPATVNALVHACARLPLALRIATATLATRPQREVARHVSAIKDDTLATLVVPGDERSAILTAFDHSYRSVDAEYRNAFRGVGVLPRPDFAVATAAAALDTDGATATRLIDRLTEANLVEHISPDRYALHDLHDLLRAYVAHLSRRETDHADRAES